MGDTGSLALGGALGALLLPLNTNAVWAIIGGLFVVEALVIIQVLYFKRTEKRAPRRRSITISKRDGQNANRDPFWIIALILAMIGMATSGQIRA